MRLLESAAVIDPQNEQVFWNMAIVDMGCEVRTAHATTCRRQSREPERRRHYEEARHGADGVG